MAIELDIEFGNLFKIQCSPFIGAFDYNSKLVNTMLFYCLTFMFFSLNVVAIAQSDSENNLPFWLIDAQNDAKAMEILRVSRLGILRESGIIEHLADGMSQRHALIIGNSNYEGAMYLPNPKNDAVEMTRVLKNLNFQTSQYIDITNRDEFIAKVLDFAQGVSEGDIAIIYYSGHGVQISDTNYLIPTEASHQSLASLKTDSINANYILDEMQFSSAGTVILILDACRNLPNLPAFTEGATRGLERGLAASQTVSPSSTNILIAYAANDDQIALDRAPNCDNNCHLSPYVTHLSKELQVPDQDIISTFGKVQVAVNQDTDGIQQPVFINKVYDHICLVGTCN